MDPAHQAALDDIEAKAAAAMAEHQHTFAATPVGAHLTGCQRLKKIRGLFNILVGGLAFAPGFGAATSAGLKLLQAEFAAACPHDEPSA